MFEKITFLVSGRVQGVFFRACTQEAARDRDITGSVWNRADGKVEGEAYGRPEKIKAFRKWLHKGSPHGRVDEVRVSSSPGHGERPASFEIRY